MLNRRGWAEPEAASRGIVGVMRRRRTQLSLVLSLVALAAIVYYFGFRGHGLLPGSNAGASPAPTPTSTAVGVACLSGRWELAREVRDSADGVHLVGGAGMILTLSDTQASFDYTNSKPEVGRAGSAAESVLVRGKLAASYQTDGQVLSMTVTTDSLSSRATVGGVQGAAQVLPNSGTLVATFACADNQLVLTARSGDGQSSFADSFRRLA